MKLLMHFWKKEILSLKENNCFMYNKNWCVVILAAGKGKRMESDLPKVLHEIEGIPMVIRVCNAAENLSDDIVIVVGHKADDVKKTVLKTKKVRFAFQKEQNGTGDAVRSAIEYFGKDVKHIMILCGDTPLIKSKTLIEFAAEHEKGCFDVSLLGMELDNPRGYGRLVKDSLDNIMKIVEEADADEKQRCIRLVNSGIYCFKKEFLVQSLLKINCNNAQKEYYLTDLVNIAYLQNENSVGYHVLKNHEEALGINSKKELESVRQLFADALSMA